MDWRLPKNMMRLDKVFIYLSVVILFACGGGGGGSGSAVITELASSAINLVAGTSAGSVVIQN
jgi:hypothetical protein